MRISAICQRHVPTAHGPLLLLWLPVPGMFQSRVKELQLTGQHK